MINFLRRLASFLDRKETTVLVFRAVVEGKGKRRNEDRWRSEAHIDSGWENHLKSCMKCRKALVKDLRDYASQIENEYSPVRFPE